MYKRYFALLTMVVGAAVAVVFSFYVIDGIVNPDPCYYEVGEHKPRLLFSLFYNIQEWNGYHPTPSVFNLIFSLTLGAIPGWLLFKRYKNEGKLALN